MDLDCLAKTIHLKNFILGLTTSDGQFSQFSPFYKLNEQKEEISRLIMKISIGYSP